jgi:hypothetical protein
MRIKRVDRQWIEVEPGRRSWEEPEHSWEQAEEELRDFLLEHKGFKRHRVTIEKEEPGNLLVLWGYLGVGRESLKKGLRVAGIR